MIQTMISLQSFLGKDCLSAFGPWSACPKRTVPTEWFFSCHQHAPLLSVKMYNRRTTPTFSLNWADFRFAESPSSPSCLEVTSLKPDLKAKYEDRWSWELLEDCCRAEDLMLTWKEATLHFECYVRVNAWPSVHYQKSTNDTEAWTVQREVKDGCFREVH